MRASYLVLLGELGEAAEPLVLPEAPPELVAPALPLPVVLPLEVVWSFRHLILSALGRLSQRVLPVPAADAPLPESLLAPLELVPLDIVPLELVVPLVLAPPEVVPVPALLGSELPELVLGVVVALGLVLVEPEPLTPVLVEAPAPVVPALLEVPVPMVLLLEAPVLDLLVAPEPLSDAQPAPRATSAAAVAAASSFNFIRISFWIGYARKARTRLQQDPCLRKHAYVAWRISGRV